MQLVRWIYAGLPLIWVMGPGAAEARDLGWTRYQNAKFGTSADVPANFFKPQASAASEDGQTFLTQGGTELRLYGSKGSSEASGGFAQYKKLLIEGIEDAGVRLALKRGGDNWLVYYGTIKGKMIYTKVLFACQSEHMMFAEYDIAKKAVVEPILSRVSASLTCSRTGNRDG